MAQYQFINASAALNSACVLEGSISGFRNCGNYHLTNITDVTKINGTCLDQQFPAQYPNAYTTLVGRDVKNCKSLIVNSASRRSIRLPWLLAILAVLAAVLPYAAAAPQRPVRMADVQQTFVITSGPERVQGEKMLLGPAVCSGNMSVTYTGINTFKQSIQLSRAASKVFNSTAIPYSVSVANTTHGDPDAIITYYIGQTCGQRCGHVTFTPFFQRVVGDFRPGGPFNYTHDAPETLGNGRGDGAFDMACM